MRTTGRSRVAVADKPQHPKEAAHHGLGWATVQEAVHALTDVVPAEPDPTPVLGVDLTRRGKPRWHCDPNTALGEC